MELAVSAFISFGDTKVFCTIYGPRANQRGAVSGPFSDSGLLECDPPHCSINNSHSLSSSSEPRISQLKCTRTISPNYLAILKRLYQSMQ
jgi:hypothetical protein